MAVQRSTLGSTFNSSEKSVIIFDDISCGSLNSNSGSTATAPSEASSVVTATSSLDGDNYGSVWPFIDLAVVVLRITFSISKSLVITRISRTSELINCELQCKYLVYKGP